MTPKRTRGSGEHPSVVEFRRKMDSIQEAQVTDLQALNARLDPLVAKEKERAKSDAPPHDPRREPTDDARQDDEVPVDVVSLPDTPEK